MWPELVLQTLTAINVRRWSFPVAVFSADGSLSDGGIPSTSGSMVGCIFELRPQTAIGTKRCRWLQRFVGGPDAAISEDRALVNCGILATVL